MESRFLESLRKKEIQCRNYQAQAEERRRNNGYKPSEEQCMLLQAAADLECEMAQVTMGEERSHHEREKNRLDYEIMKIRQELSPRQTPAAPAGGKSAAAAGKSDKADGGKDPEKSKDDEALDRAARTWLKETPRHSFEDVSGMTDLKKKLKECISDAKSEMLMDYLRIPRLNSYFFVGPPGCGKTYIIEAFAHELMSQDYKYMSLQGSDIISRYVGDAEKIVTRLFEEAINNAPCIVFIDEIDSVCKNRSLPNLPEYAANITTSFLTGYNRIKSDDSQIIFIGATNYPDRVDSAMLDRVEVIRVPLPDADARAAAFSKQLSDIFVCEEGLTFEYMASSTDKYNYRDIERVTSAVKHSVFKELTETCKDQFAAIEALRSGSYKLRKEKFDEALRKFKPSPKDDIIKGIDEWENMYQQMQE